MGATIVSFASRRLRRAPVLLLVGLGLLLAASADARGPRHGRPDRAERLLVNHLSTWQSCQAIRFVFPGWECGWVSPPPDELAELASHLRAISGLERFASAVAETGRLDRSAFRCLLAVSSEVHEATVTRVRDRRARFDRKARRRRRRVGRSIERACQDVVLPEVAGDRLGLEFTNACTHAFDTEGRLEPVTLSECVRTLADARLAEAGVGPPLRRPNIVVILVDDQRFDTIDATHSPLPALGVPAMPATYSRLAREGLTFTQMVVSTPVCGASRGSYFTGLSTHRHRMLANAGPYGPVRFDDTDTWATRLDDAGYRTAFLGKYTNGFTDLWEPGVDEPIIPPGWDEFRTFNHPQSVPQTGFEMIENGEVVSYDTEDQPYSTDVLGLQALSFVERAVTESPEEPFALWISSTTPHYPWDPAPRHVGAFAGYRLVRYPNLYEEDVSDKPLFIQNRPPPGPLSYLGQANFRRKHLEMQLSTDEMVAHLVDRLDELGVGDDTIFVYTSDNGHAWGDHRWNSKACPWEACLRVPMLVKYPRLVPGPRTVDGLVANVDVAPTLLGLAGAAQPSDVDGLDLGDVVRGVAEVPDDRDVLFETYFSGAGMYAGIRTDGLKYVLYQSGDRYLYDLEADPFELENFIDRPGYEEIGQTLHERLRERWPGFLQVLAQ